MERWLLALNALDAPLKVLLTVSLLLTSWGFKRWGLAPLKSFWAALAAFFRGIQAVKSLPMQAEALGKMPEMMSTLRAVHHAVYPNTGGSIPDQIKALSEKVSRVDVTLTLSIATQQAIFNGMGTYAMFEGGPDGDVTGVNDVYLKWVNKTEPQIRGKGWVNCIDPKDIVAVRREWFSCIEDRREFVVAFHMIGSDRPSFPVLCRATPVFSRAGDVLKWVGVVRRLDEDFNP